MYALRTCSWVGYPRPGVSVPGFRRVVLGSRGVTEEEPLSSRSLFENPQTFRTDGQGTQFRLERPVSTPGVRTTVGAP